MPFWASPWRRRRRRRLLDIPLFRYIGGPNAFQLPVPMMNILNGGKHADNTVDVQEFMIMPIGAKHFTGALRMCAEVYQTPKKGHPRPGHEHRRGRRGRLRPDLATNEDAIRLISRHRKAGYTPARTCHCPGHRRLRAVWSGKYVFKGENVQRTSTE
jgi:enolase